LASGQTTIYALKPRFQDLLRPLAVRLGGAGVTPNTVTLAAAVCSVLAGSLAALLATQRAVFLIVPLWMFARMALNAIDGMLAREFRRKTALGAYLNEIGDVVSDAALFAPFALVPPFDGPGVALLIVLSTMTEFAGVLGPAAGASRRYDGPMGKSDRAVVFGALGLWIGCSAPLPPWIAAIVPAIAILLVVTLVNRVRGGLAEAAKGAVPSC
jgi:CDP-diacylglycerol--glycerol-3-phosphate 3-phosphatidyltransferase